MNFSMKSFSDERDLSTTTTEAAATIATTTTTTDSQQQQQQLPGTIGNLESISPSEEVRITVETFALGTFENNWSQRELEV